MEPVKAVRPERVEPPPAVKEALVLYHAKRVAAEAEVRFRRTRSGKWYFSILGVERGPFESEEGAKRIARWFRENGILPTDTAEYTKKNLPRKSAAYAAK